MLDGTAKTCWLDGAAGRVNMIRLQIQRVDAIVTGITIMINSEL